MYAVLFPHDFGSISENNVLDDATSETPFGRGFLKMNELIPMQIPKFLRFGSEVPIVLTFCA